MKDLLHRWGIRLVIRRYEAILIGSLMLLSGVVIPSSWDPPMKFYPPPRVEVVPGRPWLALTFDDGPHPTMTDRLLGVLKRYQVPATFFVVGKMVDRYPQVMQNIVEEGHEVANHTYNHPKLTRLTESEVLRELDATRQAIRRTTGRDSVLFRPPGGVYNRQVVRVTAKAGYRMVLWSILTDDVDGLSARSMRHRVLPGAEDGGIILMHSGVEGTLEVLPEIIMELRKKGYHFVTVSTLMGLRPLPITPRPSPAPEAVAVAQNSVESPSAAAIP